MSQRQPGHNYEINAKTADYTLTAQDMGKIFTTRGATGAVNFTLPAAGSVTPGSWAEFYNVVAQDMTITFPADTGVGLNDAAIDSVALSTSSEKIGGAFKVMSDGVGWLVGPMLWEGQTPTPAS